MGYMEYTVSVVVGGGVCLSKQEPDKMVGKKLLSGKIKNMQSTKPTAPTEIEPTLKKTLIYKQGINRMPTFFATLSELKLQASKLPEKFV